MRTGGWFSIAPEALKTCNRCGCTGLAWAKAKNGKPYLAYTRRVHSDYREAYWVMPNVPHSCEEYRQRQADTQKVRNDQMEAREALRAVEENQQAALRRLWETASPEIREYLRLTGFDPTK